MTQFKRNIMSTQGGSKHTRMQGLQRAANRKFVTETSFLLPPCSIASLARSDTVPLKGVAALQIVCLAKD